MSTDTNSLWRRWIWANGLAEMLGLGATFALIGLIVTRIDGAQIGAILLTLIVAVIAGAVEATVVGWAQWWAMHPWQPGITRGAWWRATLIGVFLAYILGYLPSTLMSLGEATTETTMSEPPQWLVMLLAAGLGAVAGAVLAAAQWRALRGHVARAAWWIPANMLAWAGGMPLIFLGMDLAFRAGAIWQSVLIVAAALLVAGLVVGLIHGRFLVAMVAMVAEHEFARRLAERTNL